MFFVMLYANRLGSAHRASFRLSFTHPKNKKLNLPAPRRRVPLSDGRSPDLRMLFMGVVESHKTNSFVGAAGLSAGDLVGVDGSIGGVSRGT
jgi:hypothetical protein